jgi:hypothetical protein
VENAFAASPISAYGYENDANGRRTLRIDTTQALSVTNAISYNEWSERGQRALVSTGRALE